MPSGCSCGQSPVGMAGGGDPTILAVPTASPALRPEVWEPTVERQEAIALTCTTNGQTSTDYLGKNC